MDDDGNFDLMMSGPQFSGSGLKNPDMDGMLKFESPAQNDLDDLDDKVIDLGKGRDPLMGQISKGQPEDSFEIKRGEIPGFGSNDIEMGQEDSGKPKTGSGVAMGTQPSVAEGLAKKCGFLSVEYWSPYFDVTVDDIKIRLKQSFKPIFKQSDEEFAEMLTKKVDFYGPTWIYATWIIVLCMTVVLQKYFRGGRKSQSYEFAFVPASMSLIYGTGVGIPIILTFVLKCMGSKINLAQAMCFYGYSQVIYIPATLLCVIPYSILQICVLVYAGFHSCAILYKAYKLQFLQLESKYKCIVASILIVSQLIIVGNFFWIYF